MKPQLDNKVMSSMMLYVDHKVCKIGEAYTNHSGYLYESTPKYLYKDSSSNFFIYSSPHKQLVADRSITGAHVSSGIFFETTLGSSHYPADGITGPKLASINHAQGQFYTRSPITQTGVIPRQSARYAVKDFNVYLTTMPEQDLIFETKIALRPRVTNRVTGLAPHNQTYPAIFLKNIGSKNEPFAFGGIDDTRFSVRAVILSDNAFNLDAVCSILKDCARDIVPIIENTDLPFDAVGGSPSGYNYEELASSKIGSGLFLNVKDVVVSRNVGQSYASEENPAIQASFVDFDLSYHRKPADDSPRIAGY
tara:strand:- start:1907 stop:2830 length:924 start_codon:yes stop_codon:yes gene_type:complete